MKFAIIIIGLQCVSILNCNAIQMPKPTDVLGDKLFQIWTRGNRPTQERCVFPKTHLSTVFMMGAKSSRAFNQSSLIRKKRFTHDLMERWSCDQLVAQYVARGYPTFINPAWDPATNPVDTVLYTTFSGSSFPVAVHAVITDSVIRPRTSFGARFNQQMTVMQANGYGNERQPRDEKGHLVASQLGGPIEWYNLAPQSAFVNRNLGNAGSTGTWISIENSVKSHLRTGKCAHVEWTVINNYGPSSRRPTGFKLCVRFKDDENNDAKPPINYYFAQDQFELNFKPSHPAWIL